MPAEEGGHRQHADRGLPQWHVGQLCSYLPFPAPHLKSLHTQSTRTVKLLLQLHSLSKVHLSCTHITTQDPSWVILNIVWSGVCFFPIVLGISAMRFAKIDIILKNSNLWGLYYALTDHPIQLSLSRWGTSISVWHLKAKVSRGNKQGVMQKHYFEHCVCILGLCLLFHRSRKVSFTFSPPYLHF